MFFVVFVLFVCNVYVMILECVDFEVDCVRRNNEELWFLFWEIGGYWGMEVEDGKDCLVM